MGYIDYTDKEVSMQKWLEEIAPKYFDFDTSELYMTSQFGYMNEIMGTVENDTHHAVSIARREFYPTYAHYLKSFYKMAALQQINYPLSNAATASALLILRESDIITYGAKDERTGTYKFILDNSAQFYAGGIPFMLDYPVVITAKNVNTNIVKFGNELNLSTNLKYIYSARYEINTHNDLNASYSKYIKSKVYKNGAETLLLLKVVLRQCTINRVTQFINASPMISNLSFDFSVGKYMCNFEVHYTEANQSSSQQLEKLPLNSNPIRSPFCEWQMLDDETLRIVFSNNAYFNPTYNSQVAVDIYTTMGDAGNFDRYDGPLSCRVHSDRYPYNNSIRMTGKIIGSSIGGTSMPTLDDFKQDVIAAYATNKTYTTDSDLQIMFDKIGRTNRNRIIFSKKRDDCFERMYNAFLLLKDASGYIIPTNSLTCEFVQNDIVEYDDKGNEIDKIGYYNDDDIIIKAGTLWQYHDTSPIKESEDPKCIMNDDGTYYHTTDPIGNIKSALEDSDHNILFRQVDYLYEEDDQGNNVPVIKRTPDGEPLYITYPYIVFIHGFMEYSDVLIDTDGNEIVLPEDFYENLPPEYLDKDGLIKDTHILNDNRLITKIIDGTEVPVYTVCKKNILYTEPDPEHPDDPSMDIVPLNPEGKPMYNVQDNGVLRKLLYNDYRNMVTDPNRRFMVYPDTYHNLINVVKGTEGELFETYMQYFYYYLMILINPESSEEELDAARKVFMDYNIDYKITLDNEVLTNYDERAREIARSIAGNYTYINPFLIRYNLTTGVSAYYKNSFNDVYPMDLIFVEDQSILQFNMTGFSVYRNAIFGENYYKLMVSIQPSISDVNLHNIMFTLTDENSPEVSSINQNIVALVDGVVEQFVYIPSGSNGEQNFSGAVYMIVRYFLGSEESIGISQLDTYFDGDDNVKEYIKQHYSADIYKTSYVTAIRLSSRLAYTKSKTDTMQFSLENAYTTDLIAGSRFVKGNIIATSMPTDSQNVRIIAMFKNNQSINNDYYIPFVFESYDETNDSYNYSAYIKATDQISTKDMLLLQDGVYNSSTADIDDGVSINPEKCFFSIGIFVHYEDTNLVIQNNENMPYNDIYRNVAYVNGYTLANVYENPTSSPVKLLELYRFIRSVSVIQKAVYTSIDSETLRAIDRVNTYTELREVPLVRSEWARNPGNIFDLFKLLKADHDWISQAYNLLDNNFTINMKFYNTYGRSRYLMIGNSQVFDTDNDGLIDSSGMTALDSVTLKFRFGVKLRNLVDEDDFSSRFIAYIRNYIEDFNSVENHSTSIHISDLYTKLNQKFKDEILFLEFYGINNKDALDAQVIESIPKEDIEALGYNKYIPEFINLETVKDADNMYVPTVEITIID